MNGIIRKIRQYTPLSLLALFQRRLFDPHAEITQEEYAKAFLELDDRIRLLQYQIDVLKNSRDILRRLLEKKDPMSL